LSSAERLSAQAVPALHRLGWLTLRQVNWAVDR
jgi:hypothetical protein